MFWNQVIPFREVPVWSDWPVLRIDVVAILVDIGCENALMAEVMERMVESSDSTEQVYELHEIGRFGPR